MVVCGLVTIDFTPSDKLSTSTKTILFVVDFHFDHEIDWKTTLDEIEHTFSEHVGYIITNIMIYLNVGFILILTAVGILSRFDTWTLF